MSTDENPTPVAPEPQDADEQLSFVSPPALATAVVLSMVLLAGALLFWYLLGPEVRAQVTLPQLATLGVFLVVMLGVMLTVGYSHLWAGDGEVVVRNAIFIRHYKVEDIAGLRLRKGDPWAFLLVKDPSSETGIRRRPTLAIQSLEGKAAGRKVRQLRRWLVANGATSEDVRGDASAT